jgi:hypothetical protein
LSASRRRLLALAFSMISVRSRFTFPSSLILQWSLSCCPGGLRLPVFVSPARSPEQSDYQFVQLKKVPLPSGAAPSLRGRMAENASSYPWRTFLRPLASEAGSLWCSNTRQMQQSERRPAKGP